MPGKKLQRSRMELLDKLGEEKVFALYMEHGSTRAMNAAIFEPHQDSKDSQDYGRNALYAWLKADEGRWERWQRTRKMRGHVEVDLVHEYAEDTTVENASAMRVKVDAAKWRAGVLNREELGTGPQTVVNNTVNVGMAWLEALRSGATHTDTVPRADVARSLGAKKRAIEGRDKNRAEPPPSSKEGAG